ncbi:MAG: glycosyltransferase family 4 protein [Vulcanimicrobiota bacterium]
MNILVSNENRGFGGAEVHTLKLVRGLLGRGHRVRLVASPGSWLEEQARVSKLPTAAIEMKSEIDPVAMFHLHGVLRQVPWDLIHCIGDRDLTLLSLANLVARRTPLVKAEHSFINPGRSRLLNWAYRRSRRVIAVSEALKAQIQAELKLPPSQLEVIPNGIDMDQARPGYPKHPQLAGGRWVGVVSALVEAKGQGDFLAILPELARRFPDLNFVLAGQGEDRQKLEEQARSLGVEVLFLGFVEDPLAVISALEVVVVPSHRETFSLVCLEAMALGKPLVAAATGGIPEVVGQACRLYAPGQPEALLEAMLEVLADPAKFSAGARQQAGLFSLTSMIDGYEELYCEVV